MVLDGLRVAVDIFEMVLKFLRWLYMVLGGFRSFHVSVLTVNCVVSELFPLRGKKHIKLCP